MASAEIINIEVTELRVEVDLVLDDAIDTVSIETTVGPQGPPGAPGAQGPPGADSTVPGPKGDQGDPGAAGTPGAPGAVGQKGDKGDPGDPGAQGPPGADGATGATGAPGAQGPPGVQGPPGNTGATGATGPGVAPGGTSGQVLAKNSATDFDTGWITPSAGGGGNVSTSGTITVGQYAKWATVTTIQSVTPATVLSDIGAAPLASPTFTGDPKAPTPLVGDNDTSIATTAYVKSNLATYYNAATSDGRFQPLDADLTSLAAASATNAIYYRSAANTWATVTMGAGISFTAGTLATGATITTGSVTSAMLTGYADASGTVVRGISLPSQGLTLTGANLTLANDLAALEALAGTDTLYYRSGIDTWSAVSISTGLTFTGGTLTASAGAGPFQPLDADLTSIAGYAGTGTWLYRSAANTWTAVTLGANLSFSGNTLNVVTSGGIGVAPADATYITQSANPDLLFERVLTNTATITWDFATAGQAKANVVGGGGGGNVSNSGTPVAGQVAEWVTSTTITGVSTYAKLASPVFTGNPQAPTPTVLDSSASIATTSWVNQQLYAPKNSPVFTGDPQAPTAAIGDNDTSIATTAFVASNVRGVNAVRNLKGSTTTTQFLFSFSEATVHQLGAGNVFLGPSGALAVTQTAAVGANGPDIALSDGDVHLYVIWGAVSGVAGICSNRGPDFAGPPGPILPSGYTHWAYLTTVKRVGGNLYTVIIRGDWVTYYQAVNVLANGNSGGSWTACNVSAALPAIALNYNLGVLATAAASTAGIFSHQFGHTNGSLMYNLAIYNPVAGSNSVSGMIMLPNVSQTFYFTFAIGSGTYTGSTNSVNLTSYQVPNSS
jgi:Collagen triple helix repeat (20 copies)